ncbi:TraR/DksA C4-type zinc finger protein [uncultured Eudoraea sp.]|uniref:TraR/DksA family transcriptional regulator n=1 Tax=uncultured Eudoraea sp. TaxID=1035614 RepID=UPI00260F3680|nr:TraR/DksA C4-type zinc finger protein [uncultured Eudoraea sp.]
MNLPEIKDRLEADIARTIKKIKQYEELSGPIAPDNAIGRVSRMDAINNKSVMEAALLKAKEHLKGLNHYLDKLGTKDFGICPKCKKKIPIERILLAPNSTFCVTCAR